MFLLLSPRARTIGRSLLCTRPKQPFRYRFRDYSKCWHRKWAGRDSTARKGGKTTETLADVKSLCRNSNCMSSWQRDSRYQTPPPTEHCEEPRKHIHTTIPNLLLFWENLMMLLRLASNSSRLGLCSAGSHPPAFAQLGFDQGVDVIQQE